MICEEIALYLAMEDFPDLIWEEQYIRSITTPYPERATDILNLIVKTLHYPLYQQVKELPYTTPPPDGQRDLMTAIDYERRQFIDDHARATELAALDRRANTHRQILQQAITRAIHDSESGNGWGPDVTVVVYLQEALDQTKE